MLMPQIEKLELHVDASSSADDLEVDCDVEQMTQILLNLLLNAMQILTPGGHITVDCVAENGNIRIDVGDSGPGIAEADRARIFEPFFSKRNGGLGLGLAVVREIIAAHHGTIEVGCSRLGGALFTIRIPRTAHK
jgi:signal transduction histidine kinase